MTRQNIRKALIFISFLLFPVTLYYFSPYLIIQASLEGIMAGSFIVFLVLIISSLFFGRAFCGWVCPAGGLMESCATDKRARGGRGNWIKYFIWAPWIISIVLIISSIGGIRKVDFLYLTKYGISISEPGSYIIYYFIVALLVILTFTAGKRAGCHYICWMAPFMVIGSKIKNKFKYPSLHLATDKEKCINCKLCTRKCPMSLEVHDMVQKSRMNDTECILCGECVDICSKKAIKYSLEYEK